MAQGLRVLKYIHQLTMPLWTYWSRYWYWSRDIISRYFKATKGHNYEPHFEQITHVLSVNIVRNGFMKSAPVQGCQMVCFQTKNPNLGKFWRTLDWKMLIYFMDNRNILWPLGTFSVDLVHFVLIWYIFPVLVSRTNKNLATLPLSGETFENVAHVPSENFHTSLDTSNSKLNSTRIKPVPNLSPHPLHARNRQNDSKLWHNKNIPTAFHISLTFPS
jgi:hypothetical protein